MAPTPASTVYVSTPGSSSASTSTSPETRGVPGSSLRSKRLRSAPCARPTASGQRSIQSSPMGPTNTVTLDSVRQSVRQFFTAQPHVIEPCIGDPAAMDIIWSNTRLGTPGKSLYSVCSSPVVVVVNPGSMCIFRCNILPGRPPWPPPIPVPRWSWSSRLVGYVFLRYHRPGY